MFFFHSNLTFVKNRFELTKQNHSTPIHFMWIYLPIFFLLFWSFLNFFSYSLIHPLSFYSSHTLSLFAPWRLQHNNISYNIHFWLQFFLLLHLCRDDCRFSYYVSRTCIIIYISFANWNWKWRQSAKAKDIMCCVRKMCVNRAVCFEIFSTYTTIHYKRSSIAGCWKNEPLITTNKFIYTKCTQIKWKLTRS